MTWLLASSSASWRNVGISPTSPTPIRPLSSRSILVSRHSTPEALNSQSTNHDIRLPKWDWGIGRCHITSLIPFLFFIFCHCSDNPPTPRTHLCTSYCNLKIKGGSAPPAWSINPWKLDLCAWPPISSPEISELHLTFTHHLTAGFQGILGSGAGTDMLGSGIPNR